MLAHECPTCGLEWAHNSCSAARPYGCPEHPGSPLAGPTYKRIEVLGWWYVDEFLHFVRDVRNEGKELEKEKEQL